MKINGILVKGNKFAYDGCHKIYVCEDEEDVEEAKSYGYDIFDIDKMEDTYNNSCPLKFISNWKLTIAYAPQDEEGKFEKGE